MLRVVPKWEITVTLSDREVRFFIHEDHISAVLRTVASMSFSANGLEIVERIDVHLVTT